MSEEKIMGGITCALYDDAGVWFILRKYPILSYYSYKQDRVIESILLPGDSNVEYQYSHMYLCNDKLYIIPRRSKYIVSYDIETHCYKVISTCDGALGGWQRIARRNEYLFAIPCTNTSVLIMDPSIDKCDYEGVIGNMMPDSCSINDCCVRDGSVFCVVWKSNVVFEYSLSEKKWSKFYTGNEGESFTQIRDFKDYLYVYEEISNSLIRISISNKMKIDDISLKGIENIKLHICGDGFLIVDAIDDDRMICLSEDFEIKEELNIPLVENKNSSLNVGFHFGVKIDNGQYNELLMPDGCVYSFVDGNKSFLYQIQFDKEITVDMTSVKKMGSIITENELTNLRSFLEIV